MNTLHEFDIIEKFFMRPVKNRARFPLSIGDDAALISVPEGYELVTSIDTLVSGTHFPEGSAPYDIGYKSLAVSLSDLAAMGAEPAAVLLALTFPEVDQAWLTEFSAGFFHLAEQYSVELIGGNLTRGSLSVSTVVNGWIPSGKALRRSGAQVGDDIYVTGTLGDAGFALRQLQEKHSVLPPELHERFFRPCPRVQAGLALRGKATAAIDISDGLAADLAKMLVASGVGADLHIERLPLSERLQHQCPHELAILLALTAGEDYELCFTAPAQSRQAIQALLAPLSCGVHRLGVVSAQLGLRVLDSERKLLDLMTLGYQHF